MKKMTVLRSLVSLKKYQLVAIPLVIASSASLFAVDYSSASHGTFNQPSSYVRETACLLDESAPIRTITQGEFNGVTPIILQVNQQLIIPINYHHSLDNNSHSLTGNIADPSILSAEVISTDSDSSTMSAETLFTALAAGQTTISYSYDGKDIKDFNVTVVDPSVAGK